MDKDSLKSTVEEVRKSIIRISFVWEREKEGCQFMIIAGLVTLVDDGFATIIANPVFFKSSNEFSVHFPQNGGYEEKSIKIPCSLVKYPTNNFCTFLLDLKGNTYIKPVKFELGDPRRCSPVYAFVFPRERHVTPVGFCEGKMIDTTQVRQENVHIFFHNCAMHEFGYLGSPVFNKRGHLIGISYLDRGHVQAWGVCRLQKDVLSTLNGICSYVLNGALTSSPI